MLPSAFTRRRMLAVTGGSLVSLAVASVSAAAAVEAGIVLALSASPGNPRNSEGSFVTLKGGDLLFAYSRFRGNNGSDHATADIAARVSDDGGRTWRESRDWLAFPGKCSSGLQEPGVVERRDGTLYAWCRTEAGSQYETESADHGETWSVPKASRFRSPCSPLSIKRLPASGHLLAVWNDHSKVAEHRPTDWTSTSWGRTPLTIAASEDDGKTWRATRDIETDPDRGFCYTAIHCTDDAVLLAYCCGKKNVLQDTCIRRIPLADLDHRIE